MQCTVDGCTRPCKARNLCATHYQAWKREDRANEGISNAEIESFWSKVAVNDDCWWWMAAVGSDGYGFLSVRAYPVKAHRFSYELHFGEIPEGMCVCHRCDNKTCVRPEHLFLGTTQDNTADRDAKSRQTKGEKHHDAKLTEDKVRSIRARYKKGCPVNGIRALAREFGLCRSAMKAAVFGDTWKDVEA